MFFSKVVPETWSLITPFIDDILDELYDHALAHETTAKMFAGHNIEGLKTVQKSHWKLTFKNGFDAAYEERAQRIGHSHARIGLAQNIYSQTATDLCWSAYSIKFCRLKCCPIPQSAPKKFRKSLM